MRKGKGITLVALVITVIVLIILAGVTLSTLVGDNGIITVAQEAKQNMSNAAGEENVLIQNLFNTLNQYDTEGGNIPEEPGIEEDSLIFGEIIWENESAKISIYTKLEEYIIEYQINTTEGEWHRIETGGEVTGLAYKDVVFARLVRGNITGNIKQKVIEDTIAPTVTITAGTSTVNTIAIQVNAEDRESGIAEGVEFEYFLEDILQDTSIESTYTYSDLEGNTEYTLKVHVKDKAGNIGEGTIVLKTKMPEPTGWSEIKKYTSSQTFTAPEDGYYKFIGVAASGKGGAPYYIMLGTEHAAGGGGGGAGGIVCSIFALNKGDIITIGIGGNVSITNDKEGETATATQGNAGEDGRKSSSNSHYLFAGDGGAGGTAKGGNTANRGGAAGKMGKTTDDTSTSSSVYGSGGSNSYEGYSTRGGDGGNYKGTAAYAVVLQGIIN